VKGRDFKQLAQACTHMAVQLLGDELKSSKTA